MKDRFISKEHIRCENSTQDKPLLNRLKIKLKKYTDSNDE